MGNSKSVLEVSKEKEIPKNSLNLLEDIYYYFPGKLEQLLPSELYKKVKKADINECAEFSVIVLDYIFENFLYAKTVDGGVLSVNVHYTEVVEYNVINFFIKKRAVHRENKLVLNSQVLENLSLSVEIEKFNSFISEIYNKLNRMKHDDKFYSCFLEERDYLMTQESGDVYVGISR